MFGRKKKKSFLEKLTGSVVSDEFEDEEDEEEQTRQETRHHGRSLSHKLRVEESPSGRIDHEALMTDPSEGQLAVDVLQTPTDIIIRTMIAGVKPADIDIDITRDMVTIRGTRHEEGQGGNDDFFYKELYWGTFSRTILLPEEIDVELSEAKERHGLLTIRLPKVDKNRKTKLQVKIG